MSLSASPFSCFKPAPYPSLDPLTSSSSDPPPPPTPTPTPGIDKTDRQPGFRSPVPRHSPLLTVCVLPSYTEVPLSLDTPHCSLCVSYPHTPRSLCPSTLPTAHCVCPTLIHRGPSVPRHSPLLTVCVLPSYTEVPLSLDTPHCSLCVSYPHTPRSPCPSTLPTAHCVCPTLIHRGPSVPRHSPLLTVCVLPSYTEVPLSLDTPHCSLCVSYPHTPRSLCPSTLPTAHCVCPTLIHRGPSVPRHSPLLTVCVLPSYTEVPRPSTLPTVHSECPTLIHRGPSVPRHSPLLTVCVRPSYTEVPLSLDTPHCSLCVSYPHTPRSPCPSTLPTVHSECLTLIHRGPPVPRHSPPFTVCVLPSYTEVPLSLDTPHCSQCVSYPHTPRSPCPSTLPTVHGVCPTLIHRGPPVPRHSPLLTVSVLPSYTEVPLSLDTPHCSLCVSDPHTPRSLCPSTLPTAHCVCPTLIHRGPPVPRHCPPFTVSVSPSYTEVPLSLDTPHRSRCVSYPHTPRSPCPSTLPTVHSECLTLIHRGPPVPRHSPPFTVCVRPSYTEVPLSLDTPHCSLCVSYPHTPRSPCPSTLPTVHSECLTLIHRGPPVPRHSPPFTVSVSPSYTEVPLSLDTPHRSRCVSYPHTPRSPCPSTLPTVHSECLTLIHRGPPVPRHSPPFTVCVLPSYTEVPLSLDTPHCSLCVSDPHTPRSLCPSTLPTVHSECLTLIHRGPSVPRHSPPFTVSVLPSYTEVPLSLDTPHCSQ
ncbi:uncharacterized protein LOC134337651 [Mobula hypostoma]|uniref:uncharacterized protein LOC134337651 n=1 Tax=Mobula hypostoma TaxID=723540 RepID=UPI002FC3C932